MRPQLAPGLHVLRRHDRMVQVGLDRDRAVVLHESDELRRLVRGDVLDPGEVPAPVRPLLAEPSRRPTGRVAVTGFGHPSGERMVARLQSLVGTSGLTLAAAVADVAVVAGVGEPPRELVDRWQRAGVPYVLVRIVEGYAVVGPFVVPGRTACLRCLDATATDEDPAWPLLVEQYSDASSRDRKDGMPEPCDPLLADLACAWAARDVVSYLSDHRPSTWSVTVRIDPLLHDVRSTDWLRHPACGCTWTMNE